MKTCWFVPNEANLFDPWGDHALLGRGQSIDTAAATVFYEKVFFSPLQMAPCFSVIFILSRVALYFWRRRVLGTRSRPSTLRGLLPIVYFVNILVINSVKKKNIRSIDFRKAFFWWHYFRSILKHAGLLTTLCGHKRWSLKEEALKVNRNIKSQCKKLQRFMIDVPSWVMWVACVEHSSSPPTIKT